MIFLHCTAAAEEGHDENDYSDDNQHNGPWCVEVRVGQVDVGRQIDLCLDSHYHDYQAGDLKNKKEMSRHARANF